MYDYLVSKAHESLSQIQDHRELDPDYSLCGALMSGLAMFCLKDPSLLSFVDNYEARRENLQQIFKIDAVPTPKGLRKILGPVNPVKLLPAFKTILAEPQVEGLLEQRLCFKELGGYLAIAAGGTEHFCSNTTNCPHCLTRKLKSGETQYYHQMVAACAVNPAEKEVFPVFAEPITRKDGVTKNDCEYQAFKRLVPKLELIVSGYPKLILLDGLFAGGQAFRRI